MKWYKKYWIWCFALFVAEIAGLIVNVFNLHLNFFSFIRSDVFCTLCSIIIASAISIWTHKAIVNRDRKMNTIKHLSEIRIKYPNITDSRLKHLAKGKGENIRLQYLNEMEFFCVGISEGIYDLDIVRKMSGNMLVKQYDKYMRNFMLTKRKHKKSYENYEKVMEKLKNSLSDK